MMQFTRIEEHIDSDGQPELFVSGTTTDPLTGDSVLFAHWVQNVAYARYKSGESLSTILSGVVAQRISAHRQEQGQNVAKLLELDALNRGQFLAKDVDTEYTLQSPTGEIVTTFVPKGTALTLPAGHSFIAEFPVGV
jgi:hypothetical protein